MIFIFHKSKNESRFKHPSQPDIVIPPSHFAIINARPPQHYGSFTRINMTEFVVELSLTLSTYIASARTYDT